MTEDEFRRLASTYGGDLARWPTTSQAKAAALSQRLPELALVLRAELALDARLEAAAPEVAADRTEALMRAVAEAVTPSTRPATPAVLTSGRRRLGFCLLACATLGFALGLSNSAIQRHVAKPQYAISVLIGGEAAAFF